MELQEQTHVQWIILVLVIGGRDVYNSLDCNIYMSSLEKWLIFQTFFFFKTISKLMFYGAVPYLIPEDFLLNF